MRAVRLPPGNMSEVIPVQVRNLSSLNALDHAAGVDDLSEVWKVLMFGGGEGGEWCPPLPLRSSNSQARECVIESS